MGTWDGLGTTGLVAVATVLAYEIAFTGITELVSGNETTAAEALELECTDSAIFSWSMGVGVPRMAPKYY